MDLNKRIKQIPNFTSDKKRNMEYWDAIDDAVFECFKNIAAASTTKLEKITDVDTEDGLGNAVYGTGDLPKVRDIIINALEELGGTFPFVDQNY